MVTNRVNDLEKAYFKVVGMYCSSCKGERGIRRIDVDFMTNSVILKFDPSIMTKEEIKDRLEKSGYNFIRIAS